MSTPALSRTRPARKVHHSDGPGPVVAKFPDAAGVTPPEDADDPLPLDPLALDPLVPLDPLEPDPPEFDAAVVVVAPPPLGGVVVDTGVVVDGVVVVVPLSPWNRKLSVTLSLAWSAYVNWHTSPMACWAAVGGHGYLAESAAGDWPALSVAGHVTMSGAGPHGGPIVPPRTVQAVDSVPVADVDTTWEYDGGEHPTETFELAGAPRATVGWLASLLHSRMVPGEFLVNPLPETWTLCPAVIPVFGVTVAVAAA